MGNVKIRGGVGFSESSGAMYMDLGAMASRNSVAVRESIKSQVPENLQKIHPWSYWGSDNLLPQRMLADIENTHVLNAIIEGTSRFALCEGIQPAIVNVDAQTGVRRIEKYLDDEEIKDFLFLNQDFLHTYAWMKDQKAFSFGAARLLANRKGDKILQFQRDDLTELRFEKKDKKTTRIHKVYMSAAWDRVKSVNDERVRSIPLLHPGNPVIDLQERLAAGQREFSVVFRQPGWGKHYYPNPMWMAAYKWVKIAQGIPEMKAAIFENSMRPKYKVTIQEEYWENRFGEKWPSDPDEQEKLRQTVYDEIDNWLVGSRNSHKSIYVNGQRDGNGNVYTDIDIEAIEDTTIQGELLPDSAAANSEISIAMLWNPAITGGNQKAGLYAGNEGGSNVRESSLDQVIRHGVERHHVQYLFNIIAWQNGWRKKHKGLEFIIPATVLTTTDTGASTKPITTGNAAPKEESA